jgi:hypothetical protein
MQATTNYGANVNNATITSTFGTRIGSENFGTGMRTETWEVGDCNISPDGIANGYTPVTFTGTAGSPDFAVSASSPGFTPRFGTCDAGFQNCQYTVLRSFSGQPGAGLFPRAMSGAVQFVFDTQPPSP